MVLLRLDLSALAAHVQHGYVSLSDQAPYVCLQLCLLITRKEVKKRMFSLPRLEESSLLSEEGERGSKHLQGECSKDPEERDSPKQARLKQVTHAFFQGYSLALFSSSGLFKDT